MNELRDKKHFGSVKAVIYTIEFQERGLLHAHILLFLAKQDKQKSAADIDKIISSEIPDSDIHQEYHNCVQDFAVHGPCGIANPTSPCMSDGRCTKYFPKKFVEQSTTYDDGYPIYKRRDDGRIIIKNGVPLDNRYVVPYNKDILLKYRAHINVEWCNQSRSIKYLFKYINKGHDRVTANFYKGGEQGEYDEVKMYYNCRYISSCEASWRIFSFEIHFREPSVERLSFHLPGEQNVIFSEKDQIEDVVNRPTVRQSMFLAWIEKNKESPEARELTYSEFPTKFVWRDREWHKRDKRYAIGRVFYVTRSGELYDLRCLLNIVRGPRSYEEIRCINRVQYDTFRDALYSLGLLDDDKEYINGIIEASSWALGNSLRKMFAALLSVDTISRPEVVWTACWEYLSEDIVLKYSRDPIAAIVEYAYSKDKENANSPEFLQERMILATTLDVVETINESIMSLTEGEVRTYLSSNTMCKSSENSSIFQDIHTPEFLNSLKCSELPNHKLFLKVGAPVMLLRNIDHGNGLCNGTQLIITRLRDRVSEAKLLTGQNMGEKVLIPRMSMTPSDSRIPFKFQRRQFPVIVSYAITINKSQGQSLSCVGLLLNKPVYTWSVICRDLSRYKSRWFKDFGMG